MQNSKCVRKDQRETRSDVCTIFVLKLTQASSCNASQNCKLEPASKEKARKKAEGIPDRGILSPLSIEPSP